MVPVHSIKEFMAKGISMKTINVLLVEHDPGVILVIKKLLKGRSLLRAAVTNTSTVQQSIAALKASPFDVVLLDLSIPNSGVEKTFTSVYRHCSATPVILIGNTAEEEEAMKMVTAGAQDFIQTSHLTEQLLKKTILDAMERSSLKQSLLTERDLRNSAFEELQQSEEKYRLLFDRMLNGFALHEIICNDEGIPIDYRFLEVNKAFETMTNFQSTTIIGKTVKKVMPKIESSWIEKYGKVALTGISIQFIQFSAQLNKYFNVTAFSPQRYRFVTVFEDITERKLNEIKIQNLNRINRVLSNINKLIVRTKDITTVFREACSIAVQDGKFVTAWIGMKNETTQNLEVRAYAGLTDSSLKTINKKINTTILSSGPASITLKNGLRYISDDIESDRAMRSWKAKARKNGYRSAAAFPLSTNGNIVGVISFYMDEKNYFTKDEIDLLDELALNISHAIDLNKEEQVHQHVFDALQESEAIFSQLMEHSPFYLFFKDEMMRSLRLSKNFETLLGRPLKELHGKSMDELFPSDLAKKIIADDKKLLREGRRVDVLEELNGRFYSTTKFPIYHKGKPQYLAGFTIDVTDRKTQEDQLLESEEKYRKLTNSVNDAIITIDISGNIMGWNIGAEKIFGYREAEIVGTQVHKIIPLRYVEEHQKGMHRVQHGGKHHIIGSIAEMYGLKKDGDEFPLELSISEWKVSSGTYYTALIRDVTQRKRLASELFESEKKFKWLFDYAPTPYHVLAADGTIININMQWCSTMGYKPDEVIGRKIFDFMADGDREKSMIGFLEKIKKGTLLTKPIERWYRAKDGSLKIFSSRDYFTAEKNNKITSVQTTMQEITEQKRAERSLAESEKKFRMVVEEAAEIIYTTDHMGYFNYANPAGLKSSGYSLDELLKKRYIDIIEPSYRSKVMKQYIQQRLDRMALTTAEYPFRTKSGKTRWINQSVRLIIENDDVKGFYVIARDISDRRLAEEALQSSEETFRNLFEKSADPILLLDDSGFYDCNQSTIDLLGYSLKKEFLDKQPWELSPERQEDGMLSIEKAKVMIDTASKKGFHRFEWTHVKSDGTNFPVEVMLTPISLKGKNLFYTVWRDNTERKVWETSLIESEILFHTVWEHSASGMRLTNKDGIIIKANNAFCRMIGKEANEIIGFPFSDMYIESERTRIIEKHKKNFTTGKVSPHLEKNLLLWNGLSVWFEVSNSFIEREGKEKLLLGVFTDITDRKLAEEFRALQTTALESTANGILITNIKGDIVWVNQAFSNLTGYTFDEIRGKNPRILRSGKQSPEAYKSMWETILSGNVWRGEFINKKKDETLYIDEMSITPVIGSTGKITHFVAVKQDITEWSKSRKQIEEQAMLLDKAHEAIVVQDIDYTVRYWNQGAELLFGWKSEEVIDKDIRSLIYLDQSAYAAEMVQLFRQGNFSGELNLITKMRKVITVDVRMNVINDDDGKPKSVLSMSSDITEKKQTEAQLLRTQRMGSLGTLAGGIAHDLNNVLAPILLSVEFLKRTYVNESSQKILQSVESSTRRGAEIVKQILTFARGVESQKILLQPRHLVKEIITIFKETFPRSITIKSNIPNSIWTIVGDPTHFHQLIMNLGVNARDAMPNGGLLSITAENQIIDEQYVRMNIDAKIGRYVKFSITDTGTGMTSEVSEHIFEPFFTTKDIGKGTGLGLSTVYTIVKSHSGFIKVRSAVGKGTTFNIYLPASELTTIAEAEKKVERDYNGNGELILVVDDETSIREVTQQTLELYNYTVVTASNGAEAVDRYIEHRDTIVLVLTDMMMPVMDGKHLIIALRKLNPAVKIIASSGLIDKKTSMDSDQKSVEGFIDKPYTAEKLLRVVTSVLKDEISDKNDQ